MPAGSTRGATRSSGCGWMGSGRTREYKSCWQRTACQQLQQQRRTWRRKRGKASLYSGMDVKPGQDARSGVPRDLRARRSGGGGAVSLQPPGPPSNAPGRCGRAGRSQSHPGTGRSHSPSPQKYILRMGVHAVGGCVWASTPFSFTPADQTSTVVEYTSAPSRISGGGTTALQPAEGCGRRLTRNNALAGARVSPRVCKAAVAPHTCVPGQSQRASGCLHADRTCKVTERGWER